MEALVPGDIAGLAAGRMRYTQLTNSEGGILDDIMVTCFEDGLFVVVNAGCKDADTVHMLDTLPTSIEVDIQSTSALLALQGPAAESVLSRHAPDVKSLFFMSATKLRIAGIDVIVSRSGYTGEDGFEISVDGNDADKLARLLLTEPEVLAVGLGARDSLRLEAGFCLYGQDIDETTTPIEAGLEWSVSKRRRLDGGYPGAGIIKQQLREGTLRRRVGIRPHGRALAREKSKLIDSDGVQIGEITSGGFGPSIDGPVAMGYVQSNYASIGTPLLAVVRDKPLLASVVKLPFIEAHQRRK